MEEEERPLSPKFLPNTFLIPQDHPNPRGKKSGSQQDKVDEAWGPGCAQVTLAGGRVKEKVLEKLGV